MPHVCTRYTCSINQQQKRAKNQNRTTCEAIVIMKCSWTEKYNNYYWSRWLTYNLRGTLLLDNNNENSVFHFRYILTSICSRAARSKCEIRTYNRRTASHGWAINILRRFIYSSTLAWPCVSILCIFVFEIHVQVFQNWRNLLRDSSMQRLIVSP